MVNNGHVYKVENGSVNSTKLYLFTREAPTDLRHHVWLQMLRHQRGSNKRQAISTRHIEVTVTAVNVNML